MKALRAILTVTSLVGACLHSGGPAQADALADLASAAAGKEPVLWYESGTPAQIGKVISAFNAKYPDIKVEFVQDTAGNTIASKIIQESQTGNPTASFITTGAQQLGPLLERSLLAEVDWRALGIDVALTPKPYAAAVAASMFIGLRNSVAVTADKAPTTWEEFTDPEWSGRIGTWVRAPGFSTLAVDLGRDQVKSLLEKLVQLNPFLYQSPNMVAQQLAAGEIDVGIGFYHTSLPAIAAGAPVEIIFLDPIPINTIWAAVIKSGRNVEGAQVLAAWLTSAEGAMVYETATGRGNPLVPGTQAQRVSADKRLVEWPLDQLATYRDIDAEYSKILSAK
ncbi:ABC transporter substrate-binding protein [Tianweitania sediminis]|uniref:Extracellular solute-binding protein n=1 Tax=Tianweitania sediminis TaxID=1502156 RepID=A0A8J7ULY3_9HYPH|nr:extracellular solute-binding protein [Tianweitania sediminis]MBP0441435.1 extracellular solute-binding protein [Tianweitania sediminis]